MQIIDLPAGQMLVLSAAAAKRVQVLFGRIWLTESGRLQDVFASSGEVIDLSAQGRVLVEGLGFARIALFAPAPRRAPAVAALMQARLAAVGRRLLGRFGAAGAARPLA